MIPIAHREINTYKSTSNQRLISKQNRKRVGQRIEHIITRGESFWLIARKYKVAIDSLASWNNMSPKDVLTIGNKLVIWTNQTSVNNKPVQRKLNYAVKNGDSLYLIAKKFRVTIVDLARWNNLDQEKILKPKQQLIIYVDVTKQSS
jgi:membrane-bound lytic murein transglycosylase D